MKRNPCAEIQAHHHRAKYFHSFDKWVIIDPRGGGVVARVKASVTHPKSPRTGRWYAVTVLEPILILDGCRHELAPIRRPGGLRTALRWLMCQLNNGKIYLRTRLDLMAQARALGYGDAIALCWHASDRVQCIRLLELIGGK